MACDISTLESAACDNGFDKIAQNETLYRTIELQLLCAISEGGVGGGGLVGLVDPEGSVDATAGTTYYNTANGSFWVKGSGSGDTGWVALIV